MQTKEIDGKTYLRTSRGIWILRWCANCFFYQETCKKALNSNLLFFCHARRKQIVNRHCDCTSWLMNDRLKAKFGPVEDYEVEEFTNNQIHQIYDNI